MKHLFRLSLLIAFMISFGAFSANAQEYKVRSVKGNVQIKCGAKTKTASAGMSVTNRDMIVVPKGGTIKIIDTRDSQIYEYDGPGQTSVTSLIFDAKKAASSNSSTIHKNLTMRSRNGGLVMAEKGKVTRALEVYDPEAQQMQIDVSMLAARVYPLATDSADNCTGADAPVLLSHERTPEGGLSMKLENTLNFPVYFNIIKHNGEGQFCISEIGQPVGSYVVQPAQSISREQFKGIDPQVRHLMIVTNYYYDVDELLNSLNTLTLQQAQATQTTDFPLYMLEL